MRGIDFAPTLHDERTKAATPSPLEDLESVCAELFEKWDKGMKSGKLLTALEGRLHNYDPRVTRIRAALALQLRK
jgi:hypothetical protein